ncbi:Chitooligosaccharide oxidase [Psilocybe cubensis]|uniref:Chitooligosaccharide oxidase n=1 Tax=Psilocybe cubensis TaxID=181762 RepID=A0ACB8GWL0_PSICU|nr:Chitooligosaccharide oxidase [Psilocybe cubensis]KAH9480021.1 Chitooligosaccharide oxidase [Psilocybe cubensis]
MLLSSFVRFSALLCLALLASADLRSDLSGKGFTVSFPGDSQYSSLSQAYNQRYTFQPAAIALPNTPQDVSAIITASAANNYQVVARSGGHSYIANGLGGRDSSVVVDLRNFKSISVDPSTGNAVVGSGSRLGDIALALNNAGRAMSHGTCPYVGIGGHSGYGGWGFTSRMWGLVLDNILSINVVTADGSIKTASSTSNSDLFWALRGAAGSFGITTSITFKTYPVPSSATIIGYNWDLTAAAAADALGRFQTYATSNNIPATFGPELTFSKGSAQGRVTFSLGGGFYGPASQLDAILSPFLSQMPASPGGGRTTGSYINSVASLTGGLPLNTASGPDRRDTFYAKSLMTPQSAPIADAARKAFFNYLANDGFNANTAWFVQAELYGGSNSAINSVGADATSYAHRSSLLTWQFYANSFSGNLPYPSQGLGFVDGMVNALVANSPSNWDIGAYTNYIDDRLQNWQQMYFGAHYSRLHDLKNQFDPNGVFTFPTGIQGDVVPNPPTNTNGVAIHPNGNTAKCLDVRAAEYANGTPVQIYDCNGTGAQKWVINRGTTAVRVAGTNFCLDAGSAPANGIGMKIWTCYDNLAAQTWNYNSNNMLALSVQAT